MRPREHAGPRALRPRGHAPVQARGTARPRARPYSRTGGRAVSCERRGWPQRGKGPEGAGWGGWRQTARRAGAALGAGRAAGRAWAQGSAAAVPCSSGRQHPRAAFTAGGSCAARANRPGPRWFSPIGARAPSGRSLRGSSLLRGIETIPRRPLAAAALPRSLPRSPQGRRRAVAAASERTADHTCEPP